MNSFQIVNAKKALMKAVSHSPAKRLTIAAAIDQLLESGFRVSEADLSVLVTGSSAQVLQFNADKSEITLVGANQ